jgi:acyl-CoA synthetase (AMP-forming)/AMP-acid ligase II
METGGFKGRSRTVPREVLRRDIAERFGLPETAVVNQYGMTELASQFYDSTLVDPEGPRRKLAPPWARVRFVDPETGQDVRDGEVGQIVIHDLANTGSVAAIQTADLGRAIVGADGERIGFDVLGREEGAEARGCSIATDVMLEASRSEGAR